MAATIHIYAICDPATGEVRYIGQAKDVRARFLMHKKMRTPVSDWILALERDGTPPIVVVLLTLVKALNAGGNEYGVACAAAERSLISHYHRLFPAEIFNVAGKPRTEKKSWIKERKPDGYLPGGTVVDVGYGLPEIKYVELFSGREMDPPEDQISDALDSREEAHGTRRITCNGVTKCAASWARHLGISRQALEQRLRKMPPEVAVSYPNNGTSPEREAWLAETRAKRNSVTWTRQHKAKLEREMARLAKMKDHPLRTSGDKPALTHPERRERRREMAERLSVGWSLEAVADMYSVTTATVLAARREFVETAA